MKIIMISSQPIDSIPGLKYFREKLLQENMGDIVCLQYVQEERRDLMGEIRALHPDLLITMDLAGFDQRTLTDNISYNLLDCKQLHFLLHENLRNESYLAGQLSIAMFFYCAGEALYNRLARRYPHLPYLKKIPGRQEKPEDQTESGSGESYFRTLQEMLRECIPG